MRVQMLIVRQADTVNLLDAVGGIATRTSSSLSGEKFICNVTFSAPCTVFGGTIGEVMADPHAWKIALTCGLEADAVA